MTAVYDYRSYEVTKEEGKVHKSFFRKIKTKNYKTIEKWKKFDKANGREVIIKEIKIK